MPIVYDKLINWKIPEVEQQLTKRDTILYALGVGLGADPCDLNQLKFVYEPNLEALPSMAIILGYPGPWHAQGDTGDRAPHPGPHQKALPNVMKNAVRLSPVSGCTLKPRSKRSGPTGDL